jgi:hypothetical protein
VTRSLGSDPSTEHVWTDEISEILAEELESTMTKLWALSEAAIAELQPLKSSTLEFKVAGKQQLVVLVHIVRAG